MWRTQLIKFLEMVKKKINGRKQKALDRED